MTTKLVAPGFLILLMSVPSAFLAQDFEGTIKQKSIQVSVWALQDLLWNENDEAEDEPSYDNEADYNAAQARKLFDIPMEQLEKMAASGEADITRSTIYVKGSWIRIAGEGDGEAYMVYDLESGTYRLVNPQERTYLEYSRADMEEQQRKAEEMMAGFGVDMAEIEADMEGESAGGPTVEALGATAEINGYHTTGYEARTDGRIGRGWCAKDESALMKSFEALAAQAGSEEDEGSDIEDLLCEGQLPVLVQIFDVYGEMYDVTEIVAIERTAVSDELFEIPAGYQRVSMQDMWR
ncbi:MAG: DUF4412 domain-containing protein [Gemmatimonadota bacterium]|nr:MAG: DUF4412 domain-containing protein [Gemmatimonadota bacterium]